MGIKFIKLQLDEKTFNRVNKIKKESGETWEDFLLGHHLDS